METRQRTSGVVTAGTVGTAGATVVSFPYTRLELARYYGCDIFRCNNLNIVVVS